MKKLFTILLVASTFLAAAQSNINGFLAEKGLLTQKNVTYQITDDYASTGFRNIYLAQKIDSAPVFNSSVHIIQSKDKYQMLPSNFVSETQNYIWAKGNLTTAQAFQIAFNDLGIATSQEVSLVEGSSALYDKFSHPQFAQDGYGGETWLEVDGQFVHCQFVSFEGTGLADWNNYTINTKTNKILVHNTYTSACTFEPGAYNREQNTFSSAEKPVGAQSLKTSAAGSYSVIAFPTESPIHGNFSILSNPHDVIASPFGWHDDNGIIGEEYTITRGNNVYAYEDRQDNNTSGYSVDGGATLNFVFPFVVTKGVDSILDASIVNLFYANNRIHDIMHYYGFNEASGNFQAKNYSQNGQDNDFVRAETQDGSGTNNANFSTPIDGSRPRMQMYLWDVPGVQPNNQILTVNSPATIAGNFAAVKSTLGPIIAGIPYTGNLVLVNDGGTLASQGCNTLTNASAVSGKIAVIDRGNCSFVQKIMNAEAAGAIAVIVVNNVNSAPISMGGTGGGSIGIPSVMVSQSVGNVLKNQMLLGTVNATLLDTNGNYFFDSSFDNGVVTHEYGHGISTRLTGGPANSNCLNNNEQGGEGWSDFFALALTTKPGDIGSTPRGMATYLYNNNITGNGIRPARYSTNKSINPLTYSNMNGVSVPHGIGTIWASALWDMYWGFVDVYGFSEDWTTTTSGNNIALQLVIDGLKLQKCAPGFLDSRDGILLADSLLHNSAYKCIIWEAFARRGMGYSAKQGSANNVSDGTPSFDLHPDCISGILENSIKNMPTIYPNPAQSFVEIYFENQPFTVEVLSITGKKLFVPQSQLAEDVMRIGTQELANGVYLLQIQAGSNTLVQKFVVQH